MEEKMGHERSLTALRRYLKANNRKFTVEREEMLNAINSLDRHYSLEELYQKARKKNAVHAKSTIYRNMQLFIDAGFIKEIRLANGQTLYETNKHDEHEDYLLCVVCGNLETFKNPKIEEEQAEVCLKRRFEPLSHVHLIKGYCAECQEKIDD
jgi:Fur family ferric uptake transcriptional regulator